MKKTFFNWLLIIVFCAFTIVYALCFWTMTYQALQVARSDIAMKIEDARKTIANNDENKETILAMFSTEALSKTKMFARMIELEPDVLNDVNQLEKIIKDLDVDELHVSDEKGVLIACYPPDYVGYDMASSPQSLPFMEAIHNPRFEMVQEPQPNGSYGTYIQYVGVARKEKPGIVQIGYLPYRLHQATLLANLEKLTPGFRFGNYGKILICHGEKIVGANDSSWIGHSLQDYGIEVNIKARNIGSFTTSLLSTKYICIYERYKTYTILGLLPETEVYQTRNSSLIGLTLFYIFLFLVILVAISRLVDQVVINGILKINDSLKRITAGDLSEEASVRTNPEFSLLSDGINSTVGALRKAIANEAARIDRELQLAKQIQISALPRIFPPFPDRTEFDIYATMDTAKEVGGDFYDFSLVDDNHLAFLIADVSGKGVPASLFMMTAKTIIRNYIDAGLEPAEVFNKANENLYENNDMMMFVTAFLAILELNTGRLLCCCGGHNPPLIRRGNGTYTWLRTEGGCLLGASENVQYKQSEYFLNDGDALLLYTDGVTEAFNCNEEPFGETRLLETLNSPKVANCSPVDVLVHLKAAIRSYADGAVQSDDLTILAFSYYGWMRKPRGSANLLSGFTEEHIRYEMDMS